jgi:hypothetical protein
MIPRNAVKIALLLCVVFVVQALTQTVQLRTKTRIYSNVEYNEEGGDLLGYEIEFQVSGSQVTGVMRIYEGGCGEPVPLTGKLTAGSLSLSGQSRTYGVVNISGIVGGSSIKATIRMEKATQAETVKLKPIAKPHC